MTGLSVGSILPLFLRSHQAQSSLLSAVSIFVFIFTARFSINENVFYFTSFLVFVFLGKTIVEGFSETSTWHYYMCDLLGGVAGLCYSALFLRMIMIETSLILFVSILSLMSLLGTRRVSFSAIVKLSFLAVACVCIFMQLKWDTFNYMKWSANIQQPETKRDPWRNGFQVLKMGSGELFQSKWSFIDRVDLIQTSTQGIIGYVNNTAWTQIATHQSADMFPYLKSSPSIKSFLSIGTGGGADFITAKRMGIERIEGVEINEALYHFVKYDMADINHLLFQNTNYQLGDGRLYLMNNLEKHDIIVQKYADTRQKSDQFYAHYNLLLTVDAIDLVIQNLSPQGIAIWVTRTENGYLDPLMSNVMKASRNRNGKKLFDHLLFFKEIEKDEINTSIYHIIYSQKPIDNNLINDVFQKNQKFEMFFPVNHFFKAEDLIVKQNGTYGHPILESEKSLKILLKNIWLSLFAMMLVSLAVLTFLLLKKKAQRDIIFYPSLGVATGFFYGILQASFLQELSYSTQMSSYSHATILSLFLLSASVAVGLSDKIKFRYCLNGYTLILLSSGMIFFSVNYSDLIRLNIAYVYLILFVYLILVSLLFPKLIAQSRLRNVEEINILMSLNIFSVALGSLSYYFIFVFWGRSGAIPYIFLISIFLVFITQSLGRSKVLNSLSH